MPSQPSRQLVACRARRYFYSFCFGLFFMFTVAVHAERVDVSDAAGLAAALAAAQPGQTLYLADGDYEGDFSIDVDATDAPVVIRAVHPLQARMTGLFSVEGRHIHVKGLYFDGIDARLRLHGFDHKAIGNKFEGWGTNAPALEPAWGIRAEIAYNEFTRPDPFTEAGAPSDYPLRIAIRSSHRVHAFHYDAWVHHNWFHDMPEKPDPANYHSGQSDAIEIAHTGTDIDSGWIVEWNLIENHRQGAGILDVKASNNTTVRFNTVRNAPGGRIDFRNGDGGRMIANWIEDAGGIAVSGEDHEIVGNVLVNTGTIFLPSGTDPQGLGATRKAASHNILRCNTGPLQIGGWGGSYKATGNTVIGHNGGISLNSAGEEGTVVIEEEDCGDVPQARPLVASEVGPAAYWEEQTDPPSMWRGVEIGPGGDVTDPQSGLWMNVEHAPWVYLLDLSAWAFHREDWDSGEGAWLFLPAR